MAIQTYIMAWFQFGRNCDGTQPDEEEDAFRTGSVQMNGEVEPEDVRRGAGGGQARIQGHMGGSHRRYPRLRAKLHRAQPPLLPPLLQPLGIRCRCRSLPPLPTAVAPSLHGRAPAGVGFTPSPPLKAPAVAAVVSSNAAAAPFLHFPPPPLLPFTAGRRCGSHRRRPLRSRAGAGGGRLHTAVAPQSARRRRRRRKPERAPAGVGF
uniref:Uncharacterized protein n=1 Tax=Oryza sativa subsp. japonica TaxID=39947 RepID=Q6YV87_ORYSJ|nr:hypothetical protein [Oryza sativa Japonica Group]BAD17679.1 hypothetical protein [Oryza sativa Japonica Group]